MSRQLASRASASRHLAGPISPLVALACLVIAACSGSGGPVVSGPSPSVVSPASAPTDSGPVTDYAQPDNWMVRPTSTILQVDVFYLYPTAFRKATPDASNTAAVTDTGMRKGALSAYARQATLFDGIANIYAPYYRQLDAVYALTLPQDQHDAALAGAPTIDATAAFAHYIEHDNGGRPFILAGHSQGSDVLCHLLSGYLKDHPDVYARMVAAYVVGYSVTPTFLAANPHLKFAQRTDDTGVIISYNTEAPTIGGPNPVVLPSALAINPITWTRTEDPAPASVSLGSWLPDSTGVFRKVEHYADAQVDLAKGVVIASTPDESAWAPGQPGGFPAGVYHSFDYPFYYFDLQANAKVRAAAYLAGRQGTFTGPAVPLADALGDRDERVPRVSLRRPVPA
jgi:hypothetical protein